MSNGSSNEPRWPGIGASVWHTAVLFLASQLLGSLSMLLLLLVVRSLGGDVGSGNSPSLFGSEVLMQFVFSGAIYGLLAVGLLWLLRRRRLKVADLGLRGRPGWRDAGWAALLFVVYMAGYSLLVPVVSLLFPGLDINQEQELGFGDVSGVLPLVLVFLALVVVAPVAEELLMRGYLFTSLRRRLSFWAAASVTSVAFALLHLGGGKEGAGPLWIAAIDTFILSVALCYLRETTGRLWASIGLHMLKNGVAFALLFVLKVSN